MRRYRSPVCGCSANAASPVSMNDAASSFFALRLVERRLLRDARQQQQDALVARARGSSRPPSRAGSSPTPSVGQRRQRSGCARARTDRGTPRCALGDRRPRPWPEPTTTSSDSSASSARRRRRYRHRSSRIGRAGVHFGLRMRIGATTRRVGGVGDSSADDQRELGVRFGAARAIPAVPREHLIDQRWSAAAAPRGSATSVGTCCVAPSATVASHTPSNGSSPVSA